MNQVSPPSAESIRVDYQGAVTAYASQFVLSASDEELVLDCAAGLLPDAPGTAFVLPVHTRLVLSHASAQRLWELLGAAMARQAARSASAHETARLEARLPPLRAHASPRNADAS